jgi:hypothetical protein
MTTTPCACLNAGKKAFHRSTVVLVGQPIQFESVASRQPNLRSAPLNSPALTSGGDGVGIIPFSLEDLLRDNDLLPPRRVATFVRDTVELSIEASAQIDAWAKHNKLSNRSEAIRRLIEKGLVK